MDAKERERLQALWQPENACYDEGFRLVAGIDEAGRGPLAGPVTAAAVILPPGCLIERLNDSKALSETRRERLAPLIKEEAVAYAIVDVCAEEIDAINILEATKKAMRLAVEALPIKPDFLLIDGIHTLGSLEIEQRAIKGGDGLSASIAAASILAKCHRDAVMRTYDEDYPAYGFAKHKGYGTAAHRAAMAEHGLCPIHRKTFQLKK